MSETLNFNVGIKEFSINNDENKIIRFNPADINMFSSVKNAYQEIQRLIDVIQPKLDEKIENLNRDTTDKSIDTAFLALSDVDTKIRSIVDSIFGYSVSDIVFGKQHVCALANGKTLIQNFLEALIALCNEALNEQNKNIVKNTEKYTKKYNRK